MSIKTFYTTCLFNTWKERGRLYRHVRHVFRTWHFEKSKKGFDHGGRLVVVDAVDVHQWYGKVVVLHRYHCHVGDLLVVWQHLQDHDQCKIKIGMNERLKRCVSFVLCNEQTTLSKRKDCFFFSSSSRIDCSIKRL